MIFAGIFAALFSSFSFANSNGGVPISSSVLMFHELDMQTCPAQVKKVISLGNRRVNFVPSIHYLALTNDGLEGFCFRTLDAGCVSLSAEIVSKIENYLTQCFAYAVQNGLEVSVVPHLDSAKGNIWRNDLKFDPLENYGSASYANIFLRPIARALRRSGARNLPSSTFSSSHLYGYSSHC